MIYPNYNSVHELKGQYLPENIQTSTNGKETIIPMQQCLHHQQKRLIDSNKALVNRLKNIKALKSKVRFWLYVKCGADGSSVHSQYQNADNLYYINSLQQ